MGLWCKVFSHSWSKIWDLANKNELWRCCNCGRIEEYEIGDLLHRRWMHPVVFGPDYNPVLKIGKFYHEISKARYNDYGKDIWWVAPESSRHVRYQIAI